MQSASRFDPEGGLEDFERMLEGLEPRSTSLDAHHLMDGDLAFSGGIVPGKAENPLPRLSILLPALNEERGIRAVLRSIPETALHRLGFHPVVHLLDGRSTDRTRMVARQHGASVHVQRGMGKGAAFREFLPALRSEYCVILDSDATYPPAFIPLFAEVLRQGALVVLGSRLKGKMEEGAMSAANQLGNRILSLCASILYHRPVSDVCSGMWGFRTEVLQSIRITADGFDVEANLFAECVRRGIPIVEVPIPYYRRIGTAKLRIRTGLRIAWALLVNRLRSPLRAGHEPRSEWQFLAPFARRE